MIESLKAIFFLIAVLVSFTTYGQSDTVFIRYNSGKYDEKITYKTDTVIFDTPNARQLLYGTTVLPLTLNQQIAKGYGLYLDRVFGTDCKQSEGGKPEGNNEVVAISKTDTTLTLEVKMFANCCHSFLCDIEVVNDTIVNLVYFGYGAMYCDCDCCFGLTYYLSTMNVAEYDKLKMVMINSNRKTLKRLN